MNKIKDSYGLTSIMKDGERYFRFNKPIGLTNDTQTELRICVLMQGHTDLYKFIYGHTGKQTGNENVSLKIANIFMEILQNE